MQKKHSLAFFISATLLITAGTLSAALVPQAQANFAAPDGGCWCTTYVANHYHLPATYPNADKWSGWLRRLGWKRDRIPHAGDIEVLQPKIDGANALYGHVGVIQTARHVADNQWRDTASVQGCKLPQCLRLDFYPVSRASWWRFLLL